jgi:hypothetical protein
MTDAPDALAIETPQDDAPAPRRLGEPVVAWAVMAVAINWVQQVSYHATHPAGAGRFRLLPGWFEPAAGRIAWDAGLYLRVAEYGYRRAEQLEAGFPAYALAIRALRGLGVDLQTAAVVVSMASGLAAAVLCWIWLGQRGCDLPTRRTALALVLLYPYAFLLFGVAYSDPLLLALVLGTAVLAESAHWTGGGLVGGLATATRPTGLVVVPFLVVLVLERTDALVIPLAGPAPRGLALVARARAGLHTLRRVRFRRDRLRPAHAAVLLSLWGVGAYMVFLARHTGNPVYFWSVQDSGYGHGGILDPRTWLKVSFLELPGLEVHHVGDVLNEVAATAAFVLAVAAAPAVGRRFGRGYTVLLWTLALMVWVFDRWMAPGGRYLLPAVPFVAAWAAPALVRRPAVRTGVLVAFGMCSLVLAAGFAGAFDLHW